MLIKSPGDGHGAGAQGIGEESPQRRFSGARTWNVKPDPPIFSGGCAQKKNIQIPKSKLQIPSTPPAKSSRAGKSQIPRSLKVLIGLRGGIIILFIEFGL